MSTTAPAPEIPSPHGSTRSARGPRRAWAWFGLAVAAIALHVLDDTFIQPQPGTSAGDHVVSALVPVTLLTGAALVYGRLRAGARSLLALATGVFGVATGIEALHYTREIGPSGDDFTGLLALAAGLLAAGLACVTAWSARRTGGSRRARYARRFLHGALAALTAFAAAIVGYAYVMVHVARADVPANRLGVPFEDVTFRTRDGLDLAGWYVPSRNGAAVIAFPGRRGPQPHARMLARHGYGVLLFDRRGEGASDGDPHAFGWGGDEDVKAAIAFLERRPDVDPGRIGGIGLSVGGELMLEAAAETDQLAAVVSEGAGFRSFTEEMDRGGPALERWTGAPLLALKTAALAVFSDQAPPDNLRDLVGRISPRPILLIAAPESGHGEELNRGYHAAAREPKALWEIPESAHLGGLAARPSEYERRVMGFFDAALLG